MVRRSVAIAFALASVLINILIENTLAGKKYSGNDDYDDSNEECDIGRNCKPGCYCADHECRPNHYPPKKINSCHPYNYPQWKQWKKGSKEDGTNSTVSLVMVHYSNRTEPIEVLLTNNNFTTYEFLKPDTALEQEPEALGIFQDRFDLNETFPSSTPAFLSKTRT